MQGRFRIGLGARGERNPRAKLTWQQVREIRRRLEAGEGVTALSRELGLAPGTVSNIKDRHTWADDPEDR